MYRLGIDLGGTKIEGIILNEKGEEAFRERIPTEREKGYEHILRRIHWLYETMREKIKNKPHTLGIGTPGAISHKTGFLKNSNTTCLNGRLSKKELVKLLNKEITIDNDANCFALAEAVHGAGKGKKIVFGVIMGTGCGGGIVVQGKVWDGLQHIAGEWGHSVMDPSGPLCFCGARGCVETFISGGGLERQYRDLFQETRTLKEILEKARNGSARDFLFMKEFYSRFGRAMANLINILDPEIIVLGGGLSNIDELYTEGIGEVKRQVYSDSFETPIVKNKLGDSAGVIGAALIGI